MDPALIYKSNALVEASYRLSVYEQRIILGCIAQVRRDAPLSDQMLYTISAQQIANSTGTQVGTAYQNLRAAAERLYRREVTIHGVAGAKTRLTRWVQTVEYRESEGVVALRFGTDMVPYLSQLTEQFTRYALADVAKMDSAYGIRLYELICQWRDTGTREVSVEWLRTTFQLEGKYTAIKDFKLRVLDPAIAQINEHSPLQVSWTQRKTGRKVTHLTFDFAPKKPTKAACKTATKRKLGKLTDADIAQHGLARPGESWEAARARLNQLPTS